MGFEEALALVESAIGPGSLTDLQEQVLRHAWDGKSYIEIADTLGYGPDYIRHVGQQVWKMLSETFGEKVSKTTFRAALRRYAHRISEDPLTLQAQQDNDADQIEEIESQAIELEPSLAHSPR